MENILKMMQRENDARVDSLPSPYREAVQRMSRRLEGSSLSVFAVEDVRRELAGMAMQAHSQNQPLEEFLGTDEEAFCNAVIHSGPKRTWAERAAVSLPVVAWVGFAMLVVLIPASIQWGTVFFCMTDMIVMAWMAAYVLYFSTYPGKRLVTVLWAAVMLQWWLGAGILFSYPLWVRIAIQAVLFAAAYWHRQRVYAQMGARHGWSGA